MDESDERAQRIKAAFRAVNAEIETVSDGMGVDLAEFLCECGRDGCDTRISLAPAEYEAVRRHPRRFALAPGHESGADVVVVRTARYVVVEPPESPPPRPATHRAQMALL